MSGHVQVGIYTDTTFADLCLPATVRIGELLPHIHTTLNTADPTPAANNGDQPTTAGADSVVGWGLARVGQPVFSNDATLAVLGVGDGDLLALRPPDAASPAAPVIEDLADATATYATHTPFGHHLRGPAAVYAIAAAAVVGCALAGYGWYIGHRLIAAGVYAILTACAAATTIIAIRRHDGAGIADRAGLLAPPLAALTAAAVCPPIVVATAQVCAASAAALTTSVLVLIFTGRCVASHTGVAATTATSFTLCAAAALWHPHLRVWGCITITVALLLSRNAATLSAGWAKYPLPDVPAPGEKTPDPPNPDTLAALATKPSPPPPITAV